MFETNYLALDFGRATIKMVYGIFKGGNLKIYKMAKFNTPINAYKEGKLSNQGILRAELTKRINELNIKGNVKAIITMDSPDIITREVELPYAKDIDLNTMVAFELQEYLPINIEEYVIQAKIIEQFEVDGLKKIRVSAALMPQEMVRDMYEFINSLGIEPYILDIHSNAISKFISVINSVGNCKIKDYNTIAVIDIGVENTNIIILEDKIVKLNKLVDIGSSSINEMITNTFSVDYEQAEDKKKNAIDLSINEYEETSLQVLNDMAKSTVDRMIDQIQLIIKYYLSREQNKSVDGILFFGGGSNLRGLDKYVSSNFGIRTILIDNCEIMQLVDKTAEKDDLKYYINCLGALIRR